MLNNIVTKHTHLSKTKDVKETLEWKIKTLGQEGNVASGLADYIGLSIDEVQSQLQQLKTVKNELSEREKSLKSQIVSIKEESAKFIGTFGVEKLEGNIISSITITRGKSPSSKTIFKTELTKKQIEDLVAESGLGYYETVEVPATNDVIKINKRKTPLIEVLDEDNT